MAQQKQGPMSQKPKAPVKKTAPLTQAQKDAALMKKYPGGTLVKNPVPGWGNKGKATMLEDVSVMSAKKEKDTRSKTAMPSMSPRSLQMAKVDSSRVALPKISRIAATDSTKTKKMGRLRTAANDATSSVRGAANLVFGKNKSQTTGGKILERAARLGAAALGFTPTGITEVPGIAKSIATGRASLGRNVYSNVAQRASKQRLGNLAKNAGIAGVLAPVAIGQMGFKNRSEESKKRGIANPGRGNANFGNFNFDKPFQKKKAAASDSTSKSKKK